MSPSEYHRIFINNATDEISTPVDNVAGSTRCAKEKCNNWAEANSRFCTEREFYIVRGLVDRLVHANSTN